MEEILMKLLWINVYAAVIGSPAENGDTATMRANEAVHKYRETWDGRREGE
jgi:hypothetical protein